MNFPACHAITGARVSLLLPALLLFTSAGLEAQENMFWRSTGGGVFQTAANWSQFQGHTTPAAGTEQDPIENGLPSSALRAVFELLSNGTVTFSGSASTADAQVLKGSAYFDLGGNTWNTGSSFSILAPFVNGNNDPGFTPVTVNVTVAGGMLNTAMLSVGAGDNQNNGTLTLSGTTLNTTGFQIAQNGTGTLNLTGASILNTTPSGISAVPIGGQGGSHGTVNVSGGSTWNVGSNGTLHVGGFGGSGSGVLNITSGSVNGTSLNVAANSGITGSVYVNGSSSYLGMSSGIAIGQGGAGSMTISNGGDVFSAAGSSSVVGAIGGGTGSVSVSGAGSSWTTGALTLRGVTSSISVSNGGLLDTRGLFMVQSGGGLNIESTGNFEAATLEVTQGSMAYLSGAVRANVITVSGSGSAVHQSGFGVLIDNGAGIGVLNVLNGGAYYGAPEVARSLTGNAVATCTVSGTGSLWSLGATYYLGAGGGLGGARVESGGKLEATTLFIGANTNGALDVLHSGSLFTSSGPVYVGGSETGATGNGVTGVMTVQNGASATIAGQMKVWSGGTVQVSGGSLNVGSLHVSGGVVDALGSVMSNGALTVTNGGSFSSGNLMLGFGNFTSASVSGGGSSIQVDGNLVVDSGHTLTVGAGGALQGGDIQVEGGDLNLNGGQIVADMMRVTSGGQFTSTGAIEVSNTAVRDLSVGGAEAVIQATSLNVRAQAQLTVHSGGSISGPVHAYGGTTQFEDSATAGGGSINVHGGTSNGSTGGLVRFIHGSSAGSGVIDVQGGTADGALGGLLQFANSATAQQGSFTVHGGSVGNALGGGIDFLDDSTSGSGTFVIQGGSVSGAAGGGIEFDGNAGGGSASFTVNGGQVAGAEGGSILFTGSSNAEGAAITLNSGAVAGALAGVLELEGTAWVDDAVFTANGSSFAGSLVNGDGGGLIHFLGNASAGDATLIANGGSGAGGAIFFSEQAQGDAARVKVYGNGRLDISLLQNDELGIGSLEGDGIVFLGSRTLLVGNNGLSSTFSGTLQDDGVVFDMTSVHQTGGSLIKMGAGTTTLSGVSTYTGWTGVGGGTLVLDLTQNASVLNSVSELHAGGGALEVRGAAGLARTQVLDALALHTGASRITVNNLGTSTTLDLSSGGITRQESGTVDFSAVTGVLGVDAIIKTAQANDSTGIIGAWATVNGGAALAANNGSNVIVAYTGYTDVTNTISSDSNSNTRISSGGGAVALGSATTSIHTLTQSSSSAATVDTAGKTLNTGGILVSPTAAALTVGGTAGSGTLTAGDELVLINHSAGELTINSNVTGGIAMTTAGNTTLNGSNTYTGATNVASGTLVVDGSIAASSGVYLASSATLSGHGSVSSIGGEGMVAPGNSPGILSATAIEPGGGVDFHFQFTQTGAPAFLSPQASGNDVLRLGSLLPFSSALSDENHVTIDFTGLSLLAGDVLLGGFYTDNGGDFFAQIQFADFEFLGLDPDQNVLITTVALTANFGSGDVQGRITQFTITAVGATLSPVSIVDTQTAVLTITGLNIGQTVRVERLVDANGNGEVDAGDPLVEAFAVTDGQVVAIAGVRNSNVPGDEDLTADGEIEFHVTPVRGTELGRLAGTHLLRVSSPENDFTPFIRPLVVTLPVQSQSISGIVTDGVNPVPFAVVVFSDATTDGEYSMGVVANAAGQFSAVLPAGSYMLFAVKTGFVTDFGAAPVVALAANGTEVQNLLLTPATTTISGVVNDAVTSAGLPGVQITVEDAEGRFALATTGLDGSYVLPVLGGEWEVRLAAQSLRRLGRLKRAFDPVDAAADTTSGAAVGVNINCPPVTALIHGTITTTGAAPVSGVGVDAGDGTYKSQGVSGADGHYVLGVADGQWQTLIPYDDPGAVGYLLPGAEGVNVSTSQAVQHDFAVTPVTAHLQGIVLHNSAPVAGIRVDASGDTYPYTVSIDTAPDGTFDLGVIGGTWNVQISSWDAAEASVVGPMITQTVATNQTVTGITLMLQSSTANISGAVQDGATAPVFANLWATATVGGTFYRASGQTDGSGSYSLPVIDGQWTVGFDNAGDFTLPVPVAATVSGGGVTRNFTLSTLPRIDSHPAAQSLMVSSTGGFDVLASSGTPKTFQWQVSTDSGFNWNPLSNGGAYAGVTTGSLQVTADMGLNGYRYRCLVTNPYGSATSNDAQLTVTALTAGASWRQQYFGTSSDSGDAADSATPDGDGIANLLKYALVIVPGGSGASALPPAQITGNRLALNFTRDPARNDVTITVQAASDLAGLWTTLATSVNGAPFTGSGVIVETDVPGGLKSVEVRDTVDVSPGTARFMRIQATR